MSSSYQRVASSNPAQSVLELDAEAQIGQLAPCMAAPAISLKSPKL